MWEFRTVVKIATASAVAWWIGNLAGQPKPVFAAIVPLLVIRSDARTTMLGSVGRVVGVLAGVGLAIVALEIVAPSAIAVGVIMAIALLIDRGIRAIPRIGLETRNQTAISALIMMLYSTHVTTYAGTRLWETALGGAVALSAEALDDLLGRHRMRPTAASSTADGG